MSVAVASFDVFDTLLTRIWAEPHDLFVAQGKRVQEAGLPAPTPFVFAAARRDAEARARRSVPHHEIVLSDIYRELGRVLDWSPAQAATAAELELALETEGIRPVLPMHAEVAQARAQVGRIVFLSDTYLPSSVVTAWLDQAGFYQKGDVVLVSGENRAGKGTGGLFEVARQLLGLSAGGAWSHMGDNPAADCSAATRRGIGARLETQGRLARREHALRGTGLFAPAWRSHLAAAARLARLDYAGDPMDRRQKIIWNVGATVAGPLFWGFTTWCLQEAERRGLTDLYFLSRGGQIFHRIAETILSERPRSLRCHYLLTSRLAFAGPAHAGDPTYLRQLAAAPLAFHSVRQACANLGIVEPDAPAVGGVARSAWDRNLTPAEREAVADWLLESSRRATVENALAERGARARAYLEQQGLHSGARLGLVDTGWMGTIQKNIEFLLGPPGKPEPLTGFYLGLAPLREFTCAGATLGYTNTFAPLPLRRETTHLILLELMARATHGPLLGFDLTSGGVTPRLGSIGLQEHAEIALFQEAVLSFVRRQLEIADPAPGPEAELGYSVLSAYRDFFDRPSVEEVLVWGRLPHSDQMLEQRHTVLCPPMTTREILTAMWDFHRRPPGWWLAGQARLGHAGLIRAYVALKRIKWRGAALFGGVRD